MVFREPRLNESAPESFADRLESIVYLQRAEKAREDGQRVAALAAQLFAASIDHAPHAHAFEYSEDAVLQATASARKYAVAQARALLQEVDAQLTEDAKR